MINKEAYESGLRCRGMCNFCDKTAICYQYEKDIKGTKFDIKREDNKMEIKDLRNCKKLVEVNKLNCGDWFIYYNELYRVSDYKEKQSGVPCIYQRNGGKYIFDSYIMVTPVEVEINIIS